MILELDLKNIPEEYRKSFCKYLIQQINQEILEQYDSKAGAYMEEYINSSNSINWQYSKKGYLPLIDLYRLAGEYLGISIKSPTLYSIYGDSKTVIPDSFTPIISLIKLSEYGTLSVRGYRLLDKIFRNICDNLDMYYFKFLQEGSK